jgi:hypothetical protein
MDASHRSASTRKSADGCRYALLANAPCWARWRLRKQLKEASTVLKSDLLKTKNPLILDGYRAWIRTMNNASKGRCVTVTPRGKVKQN